MARARRGICLRALVCALALTVAGSSAAVAGATGSAPRQTRIQAERNVLHAHRALRRLNPRLVDTRTGLPNTDTTVACRGRGRMARHGWHSFVCTVAYHRIRVRVLYEAQPRNGFELHRIRHRR